MATILTLECPKCEEKKHMAQEDLEYRKENEIGIKCVHCNSRSDTSKWKELGHH